VKRQVEYTMCYLFVVFVSAVYFIFLLIYFYLGKHEFFLALSSQRNFLDTAGGEIKGSEVRLNYRFRAVA